jgi:hypothetical protein
MAENEKKEQKKQIHLHEKALLQSRRDAERADELARIERLNGPVKDIKAEIVEEMSGSDAAPKDNRINVEDVEDVDATRT